MKRRILIMQMYFINRKELASALENIPSTISFPATFLTIKWYFAIVNCKILFRPWGSCDLIAEEKHSP